MPDLARHLFRFSPIDVGHDDTRAFGGVARGDRAADAARPASDDGNLVF
jgi:hypothetical protein